MTNRQDRRYAAKLARQAARRGRTPAERALFSAAAAYSADRPVDLDFALPGFDEAWLGLEPELRDILDAGFEDFRREVFAEAAWGRMVATAPSGEERAFDLEPILFPVTGTRRDILAFAGDPKARSALAGSLPASGLFAEEAAIVVLPTPLSPDAVDLRSVGPAAAARLTASLADLFGAPGDAEALAELPLVGAGNDDEPLSCLLLGICLAPVEDGDLSDEEDEARRLAAAATRASWLDSYAADLPFRLGEPVFWHEAGSSLAWHGVLGEIEAALARRGTDGPVTRIDACLVPEAEAGDAVLVAWSGGACLGPFRASGALVASDIDGFAGLAEHYAGELVEHDRVEDVLRLAGPGAIAGPAGG